MVTWPQNPRSSPHGLIFGARDCSRDADKWWHREFWPRVFMLCLFPCRLLYRPECPVFSNGLRPPSLPNSYPAQRRQPATTNHGTRPVKTKQSKPHYTTPKHNVRLITTMSNSAFPNAYLRGRSGSSTPSDNKKEKEKKTLQMQIKPSFYESTDQKRPSTTPEPEWDCS